MNYSRTEADEQKAVIQWCILMEGRWPELEYIYHVPNGGSRNAREAANLKAQGVKPGVPDLELPVARGAYTGLHIELKHGKNTCVSGRESACIVTRGKNIRLSDKERKIMTEGKLQKILDLRKAIAICECIIGNLQEGVRVSLKTPNTEENIPDPLRMDLEDFLNRQLIKYKEEFQRI